MTKPYDLDHLSALFTDLLSMLDQERLALISHDGVSLDDCVAKKHALCKTIDQYVRAAPELASIMAAAANPETDANATLELDADHKSLLDLVITARDSNLVNGKILHKSQQSLREILGILSGKSLDGLYGQSGQQTATGPGNSAIARA
jgi:flagellar biosynthesis/type III secretory pathway chaperone